ncbi:TPA: hypothetical protein CPT98_07075 [Candidatus Gastranaerophilales bacterium HUM_19]|jgi:hypothetical protein|nr:MAG TPA: hypothetical protein CPT98_07075 [Candidatus Gastranaerophilales bacterium HUM_19]DAB19511.1 MAG TPA: hypothetical protein CPT97_01980 [Candidatus Gastranaerophilales bacterium HUM_17]DAB26101.1 MAG TPA: hypothetical protein CPT86_03700 [Candidatus Gastranaerophilales bacterium HUM_23]
MSELGIFIDESGFFETNNIQDRGLKDLYIVSFLFHNKSVAIENDVQILEKFLVEIGFNPQTPIHTMPLIRSKSPYSILSGKLRRKLFQNLFQFMRKLKLKHRTFVCDKKYCSTKQAIKKNLDNYINKMVSDNYEFFNKFDEVVIYYDEGQDYLTKILHNIFAKNLNNVRFKENVSQIEYRLLQCADMVCSLELINQRKQNGEHIKAIENFFISDRNYNLNYRRAYKRLEL